MPRYHYNKDYPPKGAPEEDLVRNLVETGGIEHKFLLTYGIYEQRLNRTFQSTLKSLKEAQAKRRKENALNIRIAVTLYNDHKKNSTFPGIPPMMGSFFRTNASSANSTSSRGCTMPTSSAKSRPLTRI